VFFAYKMRLNFSSNFSEEYVVIISF